MNLTVIFSLVSNVALFFMIVYFLFKIRLIKAAMIYHKKLKMQLLISEPVLQWLQQLLIGPLSGIVVGCIGSIYRYSVRRLDGTGVCYCYFFSGVVCASIVYIIRRKYGRITLNLKTILLFACFSGGWEILHTMLFVPILGENLLKKPLQ